jgi:hypothetical protein
MPGGGGLAYEAYRVDVCSQDPERVKEAFVKLLSTYWAMIHHDGSSVDCVDKVLKVLCFILGGNCVVMECRRFTLVFARRDVVAGLLGLPERTAARLVYVELADFTEDCCCFKPRVYVAATRSVEEAARGMAEDFIRECCGDLEAGGGRDAEHNS